MKPPFVSHKHGCPHCGGIMSFSDARCPYCREEVAWTARLNLSGDLVQMLIVTAGVAAGMLVGWVFFHMPKPRPETGLALIALLWYVQKAVWRDKARLAEPLSKSSA